MARAVELLGSVAYFWIVASATAAAARVVAARVPPAWRAAAAGPLMDRLATLRPAPAPSFAVVAPLVGSARASAGRVGRLGTVALRVGRARLVRSRRGFRTFRAGVARWSEARWGSVRRPVAIAGAACLAVPLVATSPYWALPCRTSGCDLDQWIGRERDPPGILDHRGLPLWRPDRPEFVRLDDLPAYVPALAVAVEDKRFRVHPGIDPLAIARALVARVTGGMRQGGSTITMQAVRQLDRTGAVYADGTIAGKVAESRLALALERRLSKDEILELYLNTLDLSSDAGRPIRGIEDGARTFFGKPASRLSVEEAALLIGMVQAPSRYHPRGNSAASVARGKFVLARLRERAPELAGGIRGFEAGVRLARARPPRAPPHVASFAIAAAGDAAAGFRTTIDAGLQEVMDREVARLIDRTEGDRRYRRRSGNWLLAAAIVMDARSGAILGYSCGRPNDGRERWDPCRFGRVPFASTLKSWLALAAFQHGVARPSDTLRRLERRAGLPHLRDPYIATLRSRSAGRLDWTVADAFARSDNYLAVLLFRLLPRGAVRDLQRLGIELDAEHPAEALGSLAKTPLEMAALTAALANGGRLLDPRILAGDPVRQPFSVGWAPGPVAAVHRLMADVVEDGTARRAGLALAPARQGFAKTGTDGPHGLLITGFVQPGDAVVFLWLGHRQPREVYDGASAGAVLGSVWGRIANAAAAAGERYREPGAPLRLAGR